MPGQIRFIFLGKGRSLPNGEGVLERLWDPRLEVWVCRGSGADPGAQEQTLCWDYSLWDDASPALSSSLLVSFSPWMSCRTDVPHSGPTGCAPLIPLRAAAAAVTVLGQRHIPRSQNWAVPCGRDAPGSPFPVSGPPPSLWEQLRSARGTGTPCSQCPHLHGSFLDMFEQRLRFL